MIPAFSRGDRGAGRAENLGVLEPDVGHDGDLAVDDVGGIEPAAEAHLDHRPADAGLAKDDEGRERQEIEPGGLRRGRPLASGGLVGVERTGQPAGQRLRIDVSALETYALGHALDMGRAVAADAQARASQRRLDQRRDRALALGARDMNRAEGLLRIAEPRGEIARGLEPDPHAVAGPALPVGQRVEPRHRVGKHQGFRHRP